MLGMSDSLLCPGVKTSDHLLPTATGKGSGIPTGVLSVLFSQKPLAIGSSAVGEKKEPRRMPRCQSLLTGEQRAAADTGIWVQKPSGRSKKDWNGVC